MGAISKLVTPPLSAGVGVWLKEKVEERALGGGYDVRCDPSLSESKELKRLLDNKARNEACLADNQMADPEAP